MAHYWPRMMGPSSLQSLMKLLLTIKPKQWSHPTATTSCNRELVAEPASAKKMAVRHTPPLHKGLRFDLEETTIGNRNNDIAPNTNPGNNIINNNSDEATTPSQINQDHQQKRFPWKVANALVMVAVVAITGVVVGVVCGSGQCGGTLAKPATNSSMVTSSTEDDESRAQDITNFINSKTYKRVDLSPTGKSPEERAMQWLINEDPLQLNASDEVDEFRLLQRYSLLTLWFQNGNGAAWNDSTNWLTANECTWFGIFCHLGVVTEVDFYQDELEVANGLGGSLSRDLGLLTDLEYFDVYNNSLTGSLPLEIGWWTSLREFYVASNFLTGSLPLEIGLWTKMEKFAAYDNRLTGPMPSEIGLWTNLEWFHVYNNRLKGSLPSEIVLWTNLEWFDIYNNGLTGFLPSGIGLWTNLEIFDIHDNRLLKGSLPSEIGLWTNLDWFDVDNNSLTGSLPSEIGFWTNLRKFYAPTNELTGTIPETIANWTVIEEAWFFENNFDGSMPVGICEFISGTDELEADCNLNCSCCTKCW